MCSKATLLPSVDSAVRTKRLAVMQPYFFPYLGYFQLFHAADKVILYDCVNYIKSGWINRNRILEINKGPRFITLPLMQGSSNKKIRDMRIDRTKDWKTPIMHLLRHNYCHSPYFVEVMELVDSVLDSRQLSVASIAKASVQAVLTYLELGTSVEYDSTRWDSLEDDLEMLSESLSPSMPHQRLKRQRMAQRVESICRIEEADTYINPIGGVSLYDKDEFAVWGICLCFLKSIQKKYQQESSEFVPDLSIIDALMNIGPKDTRELLGSYVLI